MISANAFQEKALRLADEGLEICVIGRPGRLRDERERAGTPLRLSIKLPRGKSRRIDSSLSRDAVQALTRCFEELLKQVFDRAAASNRGRVTRQDVEHAWTEVKRRRQA